MGKIKRLSFKLTPFILWMFMSYCFANNNGQMENKETKTVGAFMNKNMYYHPHAAVLLDQKGIPRLENISVNTKNVPLYEKFEVTFEANGNWQNPFDPEEVAIDGIFQTPDDKIIIVPAFYYQDYRRSLINGKEVLTPVSHPVWKLRFSPTIVGIYHVKLQLRNSGETIESKEFSFEATSNGNNQGFIRISKGNPLYFSYDDGKTFFGKGENILSDRTAGTYETDHLFTNLARSGGNLVRTWWCSGSTDLESSTTDSIEQGIGKYKMDDAWRIDYWVELAEKLNLHLMSCLETQQYMRKNSWWDRFTYNGANGGPVSDPKSYFTNEEAKSYFKHRLRYIVARWSYSPAIFSWQFWNEVNSSDDFDEASVALWHKEMADYLRELDPNKHLIHTNFGYLDGFEQIDTLPEMDLISTNSYSRRDMAYTAIWGSRMMIKQYQKPFILTEYGLGHKGRWVENDPKGIMVHNGLWGAIIGGSASTALPWGSDYWIDQQNLYHYWKPVNNIIGDIPFAKRKWEPIQIKSFVFKDDEGSHYYKDVFFEGWPRNYAYRLAPKPLPNRFRVLPEGHVDHEESLSGMLHVGDVQSFMVDYPMNGKFIIHIPEISYQGKPVIQVKIDGKRVLHKRLIPEDSSAIWEFWKTFPVEVSKGKHEIEISNLGTTEDGRNWTATFHTAFELQNYSPTAGPDLKIRGIQAKDYLLVWLRNPQFTWMFQREGRKLQERKEGLLTISNVSDGKYSVVWTETTTGEIIGRTNAKAKSGNLTIVTPSIIRSAVAKIIKEF